MLSLICEGPSASPFLGRSDRTLWVCVWQQPALDSNDSIIGVFNETGGG